MLAPNKLIYQISIQTELVKLESEDPCTSVYEYTFNLLSVNCRPTLHSKLTNKLEATCTITTIVQNERESKNRHLKRFIPQTTLMKLNNKNRTTIGPLELEWFPKSIHSFLFHQHSINIIIIVFIHSYENENINHFYMYSHFWILEWQQTD